MNPIGADEFVGYVFKHGAPEKRSRLWFIDRELRELCPEKPPPLTFPDMIAEQIITLSSELGEWSCHVPESRQLQDMYIRWESNQFTAVWKLTNTIIPHIHTFGRDDDIWRLGLWPD